MTGKEGNLCFCAKQIPKSCFFGALETNRTSDLPLRRGSLYPLSYQGGGCILRQNAG